MRGDDTLPWSLALASLNHTYRNLVPTFPQRSPPWRHLIAELEGPSFISRTGTHGNPLLGGLIYDDHGNIMSPTYSVRRGNRYRYYISSALLRERRGAMRGHAPA